MRGLTLSVVAEAHLGLAEADGVFALANAIELFELGLVDALERVSDLRVMEVVRLTWLGK